MAGCQEAGVRGEQGPSEAITPDGPQWSRATSASMAGPMSPTSGDRIPGWTQEAFSQALRVMPRHRTISLVSPRPTVGH